MFQNDGLYIHLRPNGHADGGDYKQEAREALGLKRHK
jgi:hypothetical protein